MSIASMRPTRFLAAAACAAALSPARAQDVRTQEVRIQEGRPQDGRTQDGRTIERRIVVGDGGRAMVLRSDRADSSRAWLGISTGAGGPRDTLGLLVQEVVPGSPADRAGLEDGARLVSINGTSLRASAADLEDPAMRAVVQRRLTRAMRDVKPGDEVELVAIADGRTRSFKVRTIRASDAPPPMAREAGGGAAIGVMLGGTPSRRDTLGVFVTGVVADGPAEKAGIVEGDRIAAVNGRDMRVAREDAGDGEAAQAKTARLQRAVRGAKPGDELELRVVTAGRPRTVKLKAGEARALVGEGPEGPGLGGEDVEVRMLRPGPEGGMLRMMPGGEGATGRKFEMRIEADGMSDVLEGLRGLRLPEAGPMGGMRQVEVRVRRQTTI